MPSAILGGEKPAQVDMLPLCAKQEDGRESQSHVAGAQEHSQGGELIRGRRKSEHEVFTENKEAKGISISQGCEVRSA